MWKCGHCRFDDDMFQVQKHPRAYVSDKQNPKSCLYLSSKIIGLGLFIFTFYPWLFCFVSFSYCAKVFLSSVHPIWLCEACRLPSRVLHISHAADRSSDPKNTNNSRVDDDHGTAKLRTNDTEDVVDTREASTRDVNTVMHLPSLPHTSPLGDENLYLSHLPPYEFSLSCIYINIGLLDLLI